MTLLELLNKDLIKVPLTGTTKEEILRELVSLAEKSGAVKDGALALEGVHTREAMGSTGLERGIAIPHAKTDGVSRIVLTIGIKPEGVEFQSLDGNPSKLFFLILAPPEQAGLHIEILSEIAKITKSAAFCRLLEAVRNADEVLELFQEA